jgi:uncharacterized protein YjdB
MAYQENPVYHDPGSNTWFGYQAWSMERVAEYYYVSNDARAKAILDKWIPWAKSTVQFPSDGGILIPSEISWSGTPNTWVPASPVANTNLHISIVKNGTDLGIVAALAQTLTYYAAGTQRWGTLDTNTRDLAQKILDTMWTKYYEPTGKGVAVAEERDDFHRFFDQTVYIPADWSGKMANGDVIKTGVKFIDIRSKYRNDPDWAALVQAYNNKTNYTKAYHRFWAQTAIAIANAEYGRLFAPVVVVHPTSVTVAPTPVTLNKGETVTLTATVLPSNATNKTVTWSTNNAAAATVNSTGVVTGVSAGQATITATTQDGGFTGTSIVTVSDIVIPVTGVVVNPPATTVEVGATTTLQATVSPSNASNKTVTWSSSAPAIATVDSLGVVKGVSAGSATITATAQGGFYNTCMVTVVPTTTTPCANPVPITLSFSKDGVGEFCWETAGTINFVNSWNLQLLEINGVKYTNTWSSSMPARINGKYYIHCIAAYPWSHFDVNGSQ